MEQSVNKNKMSRSAFTLAFLCAVVYFVAYMGRLSYSANIARVCNFFSVDNATAGIAGTCLFISYGAGQVINGLLCKRYNPRYAIALSLTVSALCNIAVAVMPKDYFSLVCVCWFINGAFQSILWSSIIRLLNRNLSKKYLKTAVFIMSTPVSLGTFVVYGVSALFSAVNIPFKGVFIVSSVAMLAVATVWFISLDKIKKACNDERVQTDGEEQEDVCSTKTEEEQVATQKPKKKSFVFPQGFILLFSVLAIFSVTNNFVKDGVTTWMPKILIEKYGLGEALSIFLTLFLPLFGVFGSLVSIYVNNKTGNYVITCGILYLFTTVLMALVVLFLDLPAWAVTLSCFMLVILLMSGINNICTSNFPLTYSGTMNAGLIAGVIDGFCYVGSAISTYGLGKISVDFGWDMVFYILLALCSLMAIICLVYVISQKLKGKKKS